MLTLVSGRPISFVMDLYQSLFVFRPKLQPDLFGGLRPQIHDQALTAGDASPEELIGARLAKGVALITHEQRRRHKYVVKNSGDRAKRVVIEQPFDVNWELAAPQNPEEKTRGLYRFAVQAKPGEPVELAVEEKRIARQEVAAGDLGERTELFLRSKVVGDDVKKALSEFKRTRALPARRRSQPRGD